MHLISIFLCQKKKKINKKTNMCVCVCVYKKVDKNPKRAVYAKGEQNKEREKAC